MKKVLVILLCMCILISGVSVAQTNVEAEQHVVVKAMCDKNEYKLNMVKFNEEWYINAVDLAELADVKYGYNGNTDKVSYMRKDALTILYNGDCIFVDGTNYVPAVQATVACGIRFCEYKGELRAERLRTPEDLNTQLSERVFGNQNIDISRAIIENPELMGSAMLFSEWYKMLKGGLFSEIVKFASGDTYQERYESAMYSLLEFDDDIGSLMETIEDGDELLVKFNKFLTNGEGFAEAISKEFYKLFKGMSKDEAEWQVFLDGLDEYGDFASIRYFLEDYAVVSNVIDSIGGLELISDITCLYDAQASVLYAMEDIFQNSETEYAVDAAKMIMARYEKDGVALVDSIDTIAKSLISKALDEAYEKSFNMEIIFSENPKLFLIQIAEEVVFDWIMNIDDMAEFLTLMPVYSDLQLDIEQYYYKHYHNNAMGAKLRGAGIMYLNAALHYIELLEFDKSMDLSSSKENMNKELAELLSYEESEYAPDYDNADLIVIAEMGGNVTDEGDKATENTKEGYEISSQLLKNGLSVDTTYVFENTGSDVACVTALGSISYNARADWVILSNEGRIVSYNNYKHICYLSDVAYKLSPGEKMIVTPLSDHFAHSNIFFTWDAEISVAITNKRPITRYNLQKGEAYVFYNDTDSKQLFFLSGDINFGIGASVNVSADYVHEDAQKNIKRIGCNSGITYLNDVGISLDPGDRYIILPCSDQTSNSYIVAYTINYGASCNVKLSSGIEAPIRRINLIKGCEYRLLNNTDKNMVVYFSGDLSANILANYSIYENGKLVGDYNNEYMSFTRDAGHMIEKNCYWKITPIKDHYSRDYVVAFVPYTVDETKLVVSLSEIDNDEVNSAAIVESGVCGNNVSYRLDEDGVLVIYGTGEMYDFEYMNSQSGTGIAPWRDYEHAITKVIIEDGVTTIGDYAFYRCYMMTSVQIPNSVIAIGEYAFDGCSRLTNVSLPNSLRTIEYCTFNSCERLTSIEIPDSVTCIKEKAFWRCESLNNVTIPDSVTTIGEYAFSGCESLTHIEIPNSVKVIKAFTFENCSALIGITLPNSIVSIENRAFYSCDSLENIVIPDGVRTIEDFAFYFCRNLTGISIPSSVASIGADTFCYCGDNLAIYGTAGSYAETYANEKGYTFVQS